MTPDSMDGIFRALASASRRRMLDMVKDAPGCTVNDIAGFFDESRVNVLKHLQVLEAAQLLVSQKDGRMRRLYFNPVPIQMIHDRWTSEYSRLWAGALTQLKYHIEERGEHERDESGSLQGVHSRPN